MDQERVEYLLDRHADLTWTMEEKLELEQYLLTSAEARESFWKHAGLSTLLREAHLLDTGRDMVAIDSEPNDHLGGVIVADQATSGPIGCEPQSNSSSWTLGLIGAALSADGTVVSIPKLCGLLTAAMLAGAGITFWLLGGGLPEQRRAANPAQPVEESGQSHAATLVSVTNCRWDQMRSTADLKQGSMLRSGESLHLLEGVAEINSTLPNGGTANIQLEGPLAMTLTSHGMPSLFYGHLTGLFACDYDRFTLDTPLGRVIVSGDASIGMMAAANKVELHVFSGTATLELWGMGFGAAAEQLTAAAGSSICAAVGADGSVSVDRGESKESWFMTPAALSASRLDISDEYVATVVDAKPVAYWRFEGDAGGIMRNQIADRLHCRMVGDAVRWRGGGQNSTVEFGMTAGPGYLLSDDVLDGVIGDSYSVEGWVKPTYFHHGALISLIQWSPTESPLDRHHFHLELCGPSPGVPRSILRSPENFPGRIRFIHQTAECYSESPYRVRTWQHVVAVKDQSVLRLYTDGKVVATTEDRAPLGNGLRVLMGQLFPRNPYMQDEVAARLFVGELDEVALYDRAISEAEIQKHVQFARPDAELIPLDTRPTPQ